VYTYVGGCERGANVETLILLNACAVVRDARHVWTLSVASRGLVLSLVSHFLDEGHDATLNPD
jgi:hypothetical protein